MKKLVVIFILLFCQNVMADGPIEISEIRSESGQVYVFPKTEISNPKNCGLASPLKIEADSAGFDQMYSQVLAALASKKKIYYWIRGCGASPWGQTVPYVYGIGILAD